MTERLQSVEKKVMELWVEKQKFSDLWFWKIEPNLGDNEAKKIFDELEGKEEKTVEHNH